MNPKSSKLCIECIATYQKIDVIQSSYIIEIHREILLKVRIVNCQKNTIFAFK